MTKTKGRPSSYTDHIGRRAAENICHAFDYAKYIEQPLNHYITLNLRGLDDDADAAAAFNRIRHKFRDWLLYATRKSGAVVKEPVYVYTIEAPSDKNPHANWVVHIPPYLSKQFQKKLNVWVARVLGEVGPFDIRVQQVNPMKDKTLAKYVIKGTDERYVSYLHLKEFAANQGRVWGRRTATSTAIGRTVRKRAGFKPSRDRHKWKSRLMAAE